MESNVPCIDGNISVSVDNSCGRVDVCGYWTYTNGTMLVDCPLNCTSLMIACPTSVSEGKLFMLSGTAFINNLTHCVIIF